MPQKNSPIHPGVGIDHLHLNVADLDRALSFYRDLLGFEVTRLLDLDGLMKKSCPSCLSC